MKNGAVKTELQSSDWPGDEETASLINNQNNEYVLHETEEVGDTTYIGTMDNNGSWLIKRIVEDADCNITALYANLSNNPTQTTYTLAWTNRATLTYELIGSLTGI